MNNIELFDDLLIKTRVEAVWSKVFESSNKVISQARNHGFLGMEIVPNPNIHMMLISLQAFTALIDIIITNAEAFNVDYDATRLLINAKEQITRMEKVAAALKANNREDFDSAINEIERQAAF
jgi:hypothetical protein